MKLFLTLCLLSTSFAQEVCNLGTEAHCKRSQDTTFASLLGGLSDSVKEYFGFGQNSDTRHSEKLYCEKPEGNCESAKLEDKQVDDIVKQAKDFASMFLDDSVNINKDELSNLINNAFDVEDEIKEHSEDVFEYHPMYRLKPGHVGKIDKIELPGGIYTTIKTLAIQPPVFEIENFLSDEECDQLIETAIRTKRERGPEKGDEHHDYRKSKLTRLRPPYIDAEFLSKIRERISAITRLPLYMVEGSEVLKVGQYDVGGYYNAHLDVSGDDTKDQPCCFQKPCVDENGNEFEEQDCCSFCRYITFMYYLNDVEGGGETAFPLADLSFSDMVKRQNEYPDWSNLTKHCHLSNVLAKPAKGKAIFWYNRFLDGRGYLGGMDRRSNHGGCNVTAGSKWIGLNPISGPTYANRFIPTRYNDISESYKAYVRNQKLKST